MASVSALDKYPCAACGAQAEWNPAKAGAGLLVLRDHDALHHRRGRHDPRAGPCGRAARAAGRTAGMARGEAVGPVSELQGRVGVRSRAGRAELRFLRIARARSLRRDQGADQAREPAPRSRSPSAQVREQIRRWYASKWLAPNKLRVRALVDRVHGVYIPYWTFDAHVVCPWRADAGHYYYTTETYRDNQGRRQTRQVQHVRWEPAAGEVRHFFDDEADPRNPGRVADAAGSRSSRFQPASSSPTPRPFCQASSSSITRSCSSKRPIIRRRR